MRKLHVVPGALVAIALAAIAVPLAVVQIAGPPAAAPVLAEISRPKRVVPKAELPEVAIQNDLYDTNPAKPEEVTAGGEIVPGKISSRGLQWPNAGNIGSEFGACRTGLSCEGSCCRRHEGVDIFTDRGTPIYACADGTVASAHGPPDAATAGYGYWVYIDHADGLQTRYCHMDRVEVTRGQKVARGQRIGTVGKTGNARTTPPHNHFEVRANGVPRNPRDYLPER